MRDGLYGLRLSWGGSQSSGIAVLERGMLAGCSAQYAYLGSVSVQEADITADISFSSCDRRSGKPSDSVSMDLCGTARDGFWELHGAIDHPVDGRIAIGVAIWPMPT